MAPLDKVDPRRAKSAPGAIELNRHFGAETDLLNLHRCSPDERQTHTNGFVANLTC